MPLTKINRNRIFNRLMELAEIGKVGKHGTQRFALTKEDRQAHVLVSSWMEKAGMKVRHDNFGNLIGRKEGTNRELPILMIGSHIDTVPNAGRFDGTVGVIAGIEVVQAFKEAGILHKPSIEVVAFCDEEGTRFSDGLFGSRGMAGLITPSDLMIKDSNNISRYEALKKFSFNIDPSSINESVRDNDEISLYIEMHIEQGPVLEDKNSPIGIVKGIAGPAWLSVRIFGEAGHAGTTPMHLRRDPMIGAAEIIKEIELICKNNHSSSLVGTVGQIKAHPGGRNVIPNCVEFSLDIRDIDKENRTNAINQIKKTIQQVCYLRKLTFEVEVLQEIDPVSCSQEVVSILEKESKTLGINAPIMVSGAGHDAMFMKRITDIGMIFIRNKDGISHSPKEWASSEDITVGTKLLLKTIKNYI